GRCGNGGRGGGMPGRGGCGCCVRIGCEGSGRGPPSMLGVVGRGGGGYAGRGAWGGAGRIVDGCAARAPADAVAATAGAFCGGGCTIRGWVTDGRLAGASGLAGCGVWPGSSIRSRNVG